MEESRIYLDYVLKSREFIIASKLRQSIIFKTIRHLRLKGKIVRIKPLNKANVQSSDRAICLMGVWSEEYPHGMPMEFVEFNRRMWDYRLDPDVPFGKTLVTTEKDAAAIYSNHQNLRIDFRTSPRSGLLEIEAGGRSRVIDLFSPNEGVISVFPNRGAIDTSVNFKEDDNSSLPFSFLPSPAAQLQRERFSLKESAWLERLQQEPQPISVNNPDWKGILSSSQELFREVYILPDDLDQQRAMHYANLFAESGAPSITIQGFPSTYILLVKALKRVKPELPIFVIWHGNLLQMKDDYDWQGFNRILDLVKLKEISKVGFVKHGMAEVMRNAGVPAHFIMNFVRRIPTGPSKPAEGAVHVGIWAESDWGWRKPPYAMLAAVSMLPHSTASVVNVSPRAKTFGDWFNIEAAYYHKPLPHEEVMKMLARMHLNLYVTLSECAPMLPLESLSLGSPCLMGPNSHYFMDDKYLYNRLVVSHPDHADMIAQKAMQVLEERDQIIEAYRLYAPEYIFLALKTLSDFLEFSID